MQTYLAPPEGSTRCMVPNEYYGHHKAAKSITMKAIFSHNSASMLIISLAFHCNNPLG